MKSKWMVSHNYAGGEKIIQIYRLKDVDAVDHAGNREYWPQLFATDEEAEAAAAERNRKHWRIDYSIKWPDGIVDEENAKITADTIDQALELARINIKEPLIQGGTVEDVVIWAIGMIEEEVF